ncbi:hypothetical protein P6Q65_001093 [Pseudomonas aeruginosa]|nr:hypothetical protein [Pseudomonas aeruginosa]EKQ7203263.1 hypothetical protein [Pseudomonas aeruginosa]ELO0920708.1 hypothetical protein [Pseudomonas aeruginosa]
MKPMIQAHLVERDQFGFWTHPNYPDLADNCSSTENELAELLAAGSSQAKPSTDDGQGGRP